MVKGGYQIINLENKPLENGVGMTYEGIYDKIEGTRKTILISGLNIDDTEHRDVYCCPYMEAADFVFEFNNIKMVVNDNDVVTVFVYYGPLTKLSGSVVGSGTYTGDFEVIRNLVKTGRIVRDKLGDDHYVVGYRYSAGNLQLVLVSVEGGQPNVINLTPDNKYAEV